MAEPTANAFGAILEPIGLILGAILTFLTSIHWSWWFSQLVYLLSLPVKLILIPLGFILRVILVILSPLLYILSYVWAVVSAVGSFIASLEFSVAALVGIIAGLILALCSSFITTSLGFKDSSSSSSTTRSSSSAKALRGKAPPARRTRYLKDSNSRYEDMDDNDDDGQWYGDHQYAYDDRGYSSEEAEWQWPDSSSTPVVRKPAASGLLSQTIHEEDDSSDAAL